MNNRFIVGKAMSAGNAQLGIMFWIYQ